MTELLYKKYRSSRSRMLYKIGVLKNLTTVLQSLFNKGNFIKKRLQDRRFPVNIAKFLRTAPVAPFEKNEGF